MKLTKKQIAIFAAVLVLIAAILAGLYFFTAKPTQAGSKTITVQTSLDGKTKTHTITTQQEMLGQALRETDFVAGEESSMGLYIITVEGHTADADKQEWWCVTKGGNEVNTGADSTPIADGEQYELTLKIGY